MYNTINNSGSIQNETNEFSLLTSNRSRFQKNNLRRRTTGKNLGSSRKLKKTFTYDITNLKVGFGNKDSDKNSDLMENSNR